MPNYRQKIDKNAKKQPIIYRQSREVTNSNKLFIFTLNNNIV